MYHPPFLLLFARAEHQLTRPPRLSDSPGFSRRIGYGAVAVGDARARARRGCNPAERVGSSECIFSSDQRIIAVERQADGVCRLIARQRCVSLRVTCRERRANRSARLRFVLCRANERAGTVYQRERLTR